MHCHLVVPIGKKEHPPINLLKVRALLDPEGDLALN